MSKTAVAHPWRGLCRTLQVLIALMTVLAGLLFAVGTAIQAYGPAISPVATPEIIGPDRDLTPIVSFYPQIAALSAGPAGSGQGGGSRVAYSPNSTALTAGTPLGIGMYAAEARAVRLIDFIGTDSPVTALAYSPDGSTLASGSYSDTIQIWDVRTKALVHTLSDNRAAVNSLAFSPDGTTLASASGDGLVRLWRATDGALVRRLQGHQGAALSVAFSPDGSLVASGGADGTVRLWQTSSDYSISARFGDGAVPAVAFNHSGSWLACGGGDGGVRLLDARSGKLVQTWPPPGASAGGGAAVTALEFSQDDKMVAAGSQNGDVTLRRPADGKVLATLNGASGTASLAFNADGSRLAVGGVDGAVETWAMPPPSMTSPMPVVMPTQPAAPVPVVVPTQPAVVPVPVAASACCTDNATFAGDVTIPDNTVVIPGTPLSKTWRFRNTGTCVWGAGYRLVFAGGNALGAQPQQAIPAVPPGATVDVTALMYAPAQAGAYQGVWHLINAGGTPFGPLATVVIQVPAPAPVPVPLLVAPPPFLNIAASSTDIAAGDSVTIQASVANVRAAWVNGQSVVDNFFQQTVQLCSSATFVLTALLADGSQPSQSVTVDVHGSCQAAPVPPVAPWSLQRIEAPARLFGLGTPARGLLDRFIGRGFSGPAFDSRDGRPRGERPRQP